MEASMMPTIRIEDDVMEGLKKIAEPFTDTPNSVIRRLLQERGVLAKSETPATSTAPSLPRSHINAATAATPQRVCEPYLLDVLYARFKGRATKQEATEAVIEALKSRGFLSAADFDPVSSGESKIANTIAWSRNALKEQGLIKRDTAKGIWELTDKGMERGSNVILPRPITARK
jgi:hypothetical protein